MGAEAVVSRLGLDVDTTGLRKGAVELDRFNAAAAKAQNQATKLEAATDKLSRQMSQMQSMVGRLAGAFGGLLAVNKIIAWGDAWTGALNQIRLVTAGSEELRKVTEEVYQISQRTASKMTGTAGLYAAIQRAAGDAIGSQKEVLRLTETISKLTAAGGGPASSRDSALFQLRQALGGAVLQAQEFNSLIDGAPLLVDAIAKGFGRTRSEMKKLVNDGKADIPTVIKALQGAAGASDELFKKINFTVGDSLVRISNALQKLTGTTAGGGLKLVADGLTSIAMNMETVAKAATVAGAAMAVMYGPAILRGVLAMVASTAAMVTGMATAQAATLGLGAALTAVRGAIVAVTVAIAANPIGAIAVALTAAITAAVMFADKIVLARSAIMKLGDDGVVSVKQIEVTLKDVMDSAVQIVAARLDTIGKMIRESVAEWGKSFRDFGNTLGDALGDTIGKGVSKAIDAIKAGQAQVEAQMVEMRKRMGIDPRGIVDGFGADVMAQAESRARQRVDPQKSILDVMDTINAIIEEMDKKGKVAAVETDKKIATQSAAIKQMRADAEALAALAQTASSSATNMQDFKEQLALQEQTVDLLKSAPEYYKAMGAEAKERATQDAKDLLAWKGIVDYAKQFVSRAQELSRLPRLAAALMISQDEYDIQQKTFDLLDQYPELYKRAAEGAEVAARADAERLTNIEKHTEALKRQAQRAKEIAEAPFKNFEDGLTQTTDDFWTNFVDKGLGAFDDLMDAFKNLAKQLEADLLRAWFEPIRKSVMQEFGVSPSGSIGASGSGGGANFLSMFGSSGSGSTVNAVANDNSFVNLSRLRSPEATASRATPNYLTVSSLLNSGRGLSGIFNSAGSALGGIFNGGGIGGGLGSMGGVGHSAGGLSGASAGHSMSSLGGSLGGVGSMLSTAVASFAAYQVGSDLANMLGLTGGKAGAKGASIGGAIGGTIGAFVGGPIGSAIGSFIGSTIGGLFKTGTSAKVSAAALDSTGSVIKRTGKNETADTIAAVDAAQKAIQNGLSAISALGGKTKDYISGIEVAANRPGTAQISGPSYSQLRVIQTAQGDPGAVANAGLNAVLSTASFANKTLETVAHAMVTAGKSFDDTVALLDKVNSVIGSQEDQLTQWQQALKSLNDTFAPLIASTAGMGNAAAELQSALDQAKVKLKDKFATSITDAIDSIERPLAQQFGALIKAQTDRIADAAALGADLANVTKLNGLEIQAFLKQAAGSGDAFGDLGKQFDELIKKAQALGQATAPIEAAFAAAKTTLISGFNQDIATQFGALTNPTLSALTVLLEAQKARLQQASSIGASTVAVNRLNALEQHRFFEGLNVDQKRQLGDFLGLIEDFTGKIGVTLTKLSDELSVRIDDLDARKAAFDDTSNRFGGFAKGIADTRASLADRYSALSPQASLEALRTRFSGLADAGRGGNESALQAMPQVAEQLLSLSKDLYGSTKAFSADYSTVDRVLGEVGAKTQSTADLAASQAASLVAQKDLLTQIRDSLQSPDPALDFLQQQVGLLDANNSLTAQLLQSYLDLSEGQANQAVNDQQLLNNALLAAIQQGSVAQSSDPTALLASLNAGNPAPTVNGGATGNDVAALLDEGNEIDNAGFKQLSEDFQDLRREMRAIRDVLINQAA